MRYQIIHKTAFQYSEPASLSQNELFLQPRETPSQRVMESRMEINPPPEYLHERTDFFGNISHLFMVQEPHTELTVMSNSVVETTGQIAPVAESTPAWESVVQRLASHQQTEELEAYQFVFESPLVSIPADAASYARHSFPAGMPLLAGAVDLIGRIFSEFKYDKEATSIDTTVEQVLVARKGVCQDFAHLAVSCMRSLGLAARYVSGYLETAPPPGKPKLIGADASHAWLSVYIPDTGWVDLDPTNNLIPNTKHITLAWGRDYGDVTPVKGVVMGGGVHNLSVMVDVRPRDPDRRGR